MYLFLKLKEHSIIDGVGHFGSHKCDFLINLYGTENLTSLQDRKYVQAYFAQKLWRIVEKWILKTVREFFCFKLVLFS